MATTPIPPYDPNPEEPTEPTLSRKVLSAAEELRDIKGVLQRCLRVPAGETATQLPIAHARKGGLLGFDASTGQPVVLDVQGDLVGVPGPQGPAGIPGAPGAPGSNGADGAPGADGRTAQFHVAYANSADGTVGFNQFNGAYVGTYVDFVSQDSTNPADYRWRLFQGAQGPQGLQGIPGVNGATGATTYLHIKYSNDGGVTFTANTGENPGAYVGVYHDSTEGDSTNPTSYTWTKIQGDPGAQGQPGAQGPQGQAGVPGAPGTPGSRGATTAWAATSGTSWNSSEADAAIAASGYGAPQTIDRVTLVNSAAGYVETRYYSGGSWIVAAEVLDGNLVVKGTITTAALEVGAVTARSDLLPTTYESTNVSATTPLAWETTKSLGTVLSSGAPLIVSGAIATLFVVNQSALLTSCTVTGTLFYTNSLPGSEVISGTFSFPLDFNSTNADRRTMRVSIPIFAKILVPAGQTTQITVAIQGSFTASANATGSGHLEWRPKLLVQENKV